MSDKLEPQIRTESKPVEEWTWMQGAAKGGKRVKDETAAAVLALVVGDGR
jgi:hypothetical protein